MLTSNLSHCAINLCWGCTGSPIVIHQRIPVLQLALAVWFPQVCGSKTSSYDRFVSNFHPVWSFYHAQSFFGKISLPPTSNICLGFQCFWRIFPPNLTFGDVASLLVSPQFHSVCNILVLCLSCFCSDPSSPHGLPHSGFILPRLVGGLASWTCF